MNQSPYEKIASLWVGVDSTGLHESTALTARRSYRKQGEPNLTRKGMKDRKSRHLRERQKLRQPRRIRQLFARLTQ